MDNRLLQFSSKSRYERVNLVGRVNFSVSSFGVQTVSINHGLGYIPYVKLFYTYGGGRIYSLFPGGLSFGIDGNSGQIDDVIVTESSVSVTVSEGSGAGSISGTIFYRIYEDRS